MIKWLVLLIPHWETDTVVLQEKGDELHIVCSYSDIKPGECSTGCVNLKPSHGLTGLSHTVSLSTSAHLNQG